MTTESNLQRISAETLKHFPPHVPADGQAQSIIRKAWDDETKFMIISGAPGVGKTRAAEDYVAGLLVDYNTQHDMKKCRITNLFPDYASKVYSEVELQSELESKHIEFVWDLIVLHPQYSYEDLIRGSRFMPGKGLERLIEAREGILGFISRVTATLSKLRSVSTVPRGVLIMDEINRAPIGQLFGEAIYALDRRGTAVATPYSIDGIGSTLTVPEELLILGTMNSIDRTISGFDFALRRRFCVINMMSSPEPVEKRWIGFTVQHRNLAVALYESVRNAIMQSTPRGIVPKEELVLGHAFFIPPPKVSESDKALNWLIHSYIHKILPTMLDYSEQGLINYDRQHLQIPQKEVLLGEKHLAAVARDEVKNQFLALMGGSEA